MSLENALTVRELGECVAERLQLLELPPQQYQAELDWFLEVATGYTASERMIHGDAPVRREAISKLASWLDRRLDERAPIQYILGYAWFYGLKLAVTPDVLIPRPETELLVDEAVAFCKARYQELNRPVKVADICTGSGAIPIAIKHTLGDQVAVSAADISPEAVAIARQNAQTIGVNVSFCTGDLLGPFEESGDRFDLIVANPPYVEVSGARSMTREVVDHEPHLALFAPGHRLSIHERYIAEAPKYLANGHGPVAVEIGYDLAGPVVALFEKNGYSDIRVLRDFAGLERLVWAEYRPKG